VEIQEYKQIWFLGLNAKKIAGSNSKPYNYGYDDERGDYQTVMRDHLGFRFEILDTLGRGSFG
jgi:dual specificity tyrosine-phosphorylation-regulated kinase 2/3/4